MIYLSRMTLLSVRYLLRGVRISVLTPANTSLLLLPWITDSNSSKTIFSIILWLFWLLIRLLLGLFKISNKRPTNLKEVSLRLTVIWGVGSTLLISFTVEELVIRLLSAKIE